MRPEEKQPGGWLLGLALAVVFGAANAYLGLKAGMTVSASIPAAVISMAILRGLLRRGSVLENNIAQTIASAGESLAAGVVFTIPALLLLNLPAGVVKIFLLSSIGGVLGILGFAMFRKQLIEEEHGILPYPEGTACAEVLQAPERSQREARFVFGGVGFGALYKTLLQIDAFRNLVGWMVSSYSYMAMDLTPALGGVGLILGRRIAGWVFAGGVLGWGVFLPLILFVRGQGLASPEDAYELWSSTIRYIGAGAVLAGGVVAFLKALRALFGQREHLLSGGLSVRSVFVGFGLLTVGLLALGLPLAAALGTLIFGVLFAGVSGRITGLVGSSSNPVSGMTIATLVLISLLLVQMGVTGTSGMLAALTVGAVVCIAAAVAGDTAQDLKTGYLVGATARTQQIAEILGVLVSAAVIGWVVLLLHKTYGIGSRALPAPQATLMRLVVEGVFRGGLPWALMGIGAVVALVFELLGIASLPVAVGLYLPLELSVPIFLGGLLTRGTSREVLYASGIIAGDTLVGLGFALLATVNLSITSPFHVPSWVGWTLWWGVMLGYRWKQR